MRRKAIEFSCGKMIIGVTCRFTVRVFPHATEDTAAGGEASNGTRGNKMCVNEQ